MEMSIKIKFENIHGIFYSGSLMEGSVTIQLPTALTLKGITLIFQGTSYVRWNQGKSYTSATEEYFNCEIVLFGKNTSQASDPEVLVEGCHVYPFTFKLPDLLPSSFESLNGCVRYKVTCVIDRPWKLKKKEKRIFTVVSNAQPDAATVNNSIDTTVEKRQCCLFCTSEPIKVMFGIERQGWVPGEAIKPFVDIRNGTSRSIAKSEVALKMKWIVFARGSFKIVYKKIVCVTRPSIEPFGEDSWTGEKLIIPPLPPSGLPGCNLIDIQYHLEMKLVPSGPHRVLRVTLPVSISTLPLISVIEQPPPMAPPDAAPTTIPNLPSPTFIAGPDFQGKYAHFFPYYNTCSLTTTPALFDGETSDCRNPLLVE